MLNAPTENCITRFRLGNLSAEAAKGKHPTEFTSNGDLVPIRKNRTQFVADVGGHMAIIAGRLSCWSSALLTVASLSIA